MSDRLVLCFAPFSPHHVATHTFLWKLQNTSVHVLCTTSSKSHRRYFFFGLVQLGGEIIVSTFDQPSHRVQRRVFVLRARHLPQHYVVFCVFHTLFARARCSALALLFRRIDIVLREENNNRYTGYTYTRNRVVLPWVGETADRTPLSSSRLAYLHQLFWKKNGILLLTKRVAGGHMVVAPVV